MPSIVDELLSEINPAPSVDRKLIDSEQVDDLLKQFDRPLGPEDVVQSGIEDKNTAIMSAFSGFGIDIGTEDDPLSVEDTATIAARHGIKAEGASTAARAVIGVLPRLETALGPIRDILEKVEGVPIKGTRVGPETGKIEFRQEGSDQWELLDKPSPELADFIATIPDLGRIAAEVFAGVGGGLLGVASGNPLAVGVGAVGAEATASAASVITRLYGLQVAGFDVPDELIVQEAISAFGTTAAFGGVGGVVLPALFRKITGKLPKALRKFATDEVLTAVEQGENISESSRIPFSVGQATRDIEPELLTAEEQLIRMGEEGRGLFNIRGSQNIALGEKTAALGPQASTGQKREALGFLREEAGVKPLRAMEKSVVDADAARDQVVKDAVRNAVDFEEAGAQARRNIQRAGEAKIDVLGKRYNDVFSDPEIAGSLVDADKFRDVMNPLIKEIRAVNLKSINSADMPVLEDLETFGLAEVTAKEALSKPSTPPGFRVDNPGGRWLRDKKKAAQAALNDPDVPLHSVSGRGLRGSPTATAGMEDPLLLSPKFLRQFKGVMGESPQAGGAKFDELLPQLETDRQVKSAVLIGVNHKGEAYIIEGNNRIAIADKLGIDEIPVWIQWYNGAEALKENVLSPHKVAQAAKIIQKDPPVDVASVQRDLSSLRDEMRKMETMGITGKQNRVITDIHDKLRKARNKALSKDQLSRVVGIEEAYGRAQAEFRRGILGRLIRPGDQGGFNMMDKRVIPSLLSSPNELGIALNVLEKEPAGRHAIKQIKRGVMAVYRDRVGVNKGTINPKAHEAFVSDPNNRKALRKLFTPEEMKRFSNIGRFVRQAKKVAQDAADFTRKVKGRRKNLAPFLDANEENLIATDLFRPRNAKLLKQARGFLNDWPEKLESFDAEIADVVRQRISSSSDVQTGQLIPSAPKIDALFNDRARMDMIRDSLGTDYILGLRRIREGLKLSDPNIPFRDFELSRRITPNEVLRTAAKWLRVPAPPLSAKGRALSAYVATSRAQVAREVGAILSDPKRFKNLISKEQNIRDTSRVAAILSAQGLHAWATLVDRPDLLDEPDQ